MSLQSVDQEEKKEEKKQDDDIDPKSINWDKIYLHQDIVFRQSIKQDASILVKNIITPSYNQSLFEFKYIINRDYKYIRKEIISSLFLKLINYYINKNNKHNYNCYTLYNKNLDILAGNILIANNKTSQPSLMKLLLSSSIWSDVIFKIPYKSGILTVWKLIEIYYAQKLIHYECKKRFKNKINYYSIEMICVQQRYQKYGYGSFMIQNIHKQIYKDNNENTLLPIILTFTSTPESLHLYENNGYKLFIKVYIGVELTYYGYLYHKNKNYLNKILTAFPDDYEIDLNIYSHLLPKSILNGLLLIIMFPLIFIYVWIFVLFHMIKNFNT